MKLKYLLLGLVLAVVATGAWAGRLIYRAKHDLVTLDVYNAPVAEVLRQIESQTREKIVAPKSLAAKVTLNLKNVPLDEALDRLGEQAGASWSKWHAVYGSERALSQLATALPERAKLADIGWTNLAPQLGAAGDLPPGLEKLPAGSVTINSESEGTGSPQRRVIRLNPEDIKGGDVQAALREKLKAAGVDESALNLASSSTGSNMVIKTSGTRPAIRMFTRTRDANGAVTDEVWSPEHVVLEERLQAKLGAEDFSEASQATARQVATTVKGRLATLYVLRPAPIGMSFGNSIVRKLHSGAPGDTNATLDQLPPMLNIEAAVQRAEAENYTRLTPEQRVQRAREKQSTKASQ